MAASLTNILNPISYESTFYPEERSSKKVKTEDSNLPNHDARINNVAQLQLSFRNSATVADKGTYNLPTNDNRASFRVDFNTNFGYFKLLDSKESSKFSNVNILPEFEYQSETTVRLKRQELLTSLIKNQMGLSIFTAKYLLSMEKLFSECHTFSKEQVDFQGNKFHSGQLVVEKLKELAKNDQIIMEVWSTVSSVSKMDDEKKFLKNALYMENVEDKPWVLYFDPKTMPSDELIVVQTTNQAFFTTPDSIDFKNVLAIKRW